MDGVQRRREPSHLFSAHLPQLLVDCEAQEVPPSRYPSIDCIEAQGPMFHEASLAMHVYRGVVQSSAGVPIPQAHVRVQSSSKLLVTNELGAFEMQLALDSVDVEVSATGFVPKTVRLAADLPKVFIGLEEAIHDLAVLQGRKGSNTCIIQVNQTWI